MIDRWRNEEFWSIWESDLYGNWYTTRGGMSLDEATAERSGKGLLVPDRYLNPGAVDALRGARVADPILDEIVESVKKNADEERTFGPTVARLATPMFWSFSRACKEWQAQEMIPGRISCQIDTIDDSVWSDDEQEEIGLLNQPHVEREISEWEGCVVVPSVPYSEEVLVFAREEFRTILKPTPTEAAVDEYVASIAASYTEEMPLREFVGVAYLEDKAVRFRLMARHVSEAAYAAKLHFGDVRTSVRNEEDAKRPR